MAGRLLEQLEERRLLSASFSAWTHSADLTSAATTSTPTLTTTTAAAGAWTGGVRATPQKRARHHKSVPPPPAPPSAPANLIVTSTTTSTVTIQFNDTSSTETGFEIQRSINGAKFANFTKLFAYKGAKAHTFNDILLKPGTNYAYRIRAVNAGGASEYSTPVTAVTGTIAPPPVVVPPPPVVNPPPVVPPKPGEVAKKILFIGNSFTLYNDVPGLVATFASADGHPRPLVAGQLHLGWGLADHLGQIAQEGSSNVIYSQVFDDVIYQDLTERPTTGGGDVKGFRADAKKIIGLVQSHSPNVHIIGFETWARGAWNPVYPSIYANPATMEAQLLQGYTLSRNDFNAMKAGSAEVSPAGEAFKALNWDRSLYDGNDEYHAGPKGSALAALMLYKTTYHENVSDISAAAVSGTLASLGLSAADWATLTAVADSIPAVG